MKRYECQGHTVPPAIRAKQAEAAELSLKHPIGTPCTFWSGSKEGPGRAGTIKSAFYVFSSGEIVVHVEGHRGCLAATHVDPAPRLPALDEQEQE